MSEMLTRELGNKFIYIHKLPGVDPGGGDTWIFRHAKSSKKLSSNNLVHNVCMELLIQQAILVYEAHSASLSACILELIF